ncbi:hypothetical protein [Microbacterium pumilum]|uniref:Uncharacterized protein n=1 Tax=Microbacterium pumilum TaxID=344165 RepID=A0ABN2T3Y6_9MICO
MLRRVVLSALTIAVLVVNTPAPAEAAAEPCRVGAPIVNVTETVLNVVDVGLDGHIWALDDYGSWLRIWRTGPDRYCVIEHAVGSFTAFAGASPALTGTVAEGRKGGFVGTTTYRVTGTFSPKAAQTGYLGLIDAGCDREENCATFDYRFTEQYFATVDSFDIDSFNAAYASPRHGRWIQTIDSSTGDIVG